MAPAQSVRPDIYDVPVTPDAAPHYLSSAGHATAPPTSSARRSDTLTRSSLGGFRPSLTQPGLDTRKRNACLPDIPSGSKRNRQPAKAYSASPSRSYRSVSTSPSEAIVCPTTPNGKQMAPRPPALSVSKANLQALTKAALPLHYPGLSPEDVCLNILGNDYEQLDEDEYKKFKTRIRQGLGVLFQENRISRQRARGPNGGPAYEYVSKESGRADRLPDQVNSTGSPHAGTAEGSLVPSETPRATSEPQAGPTVSRGTQPDSVPESDFDGVLPQTPNEVAATGVQHPQVAANGGNVAETHKQRDSCNPSSGTEDTDMAIMELGKQVTQARMLHAQSMEAMNHVSDLKIQQQAIQDNYTALESKAHAEEAEAQEFVAEAQKLRHQASGGKGRAAEIRKQSIRSMGEARRGSEQHKEREEVVVKAEDEALKIKERLQEVKRALGID
ncbi:hypothetical protein LTR91_024957 [Friedmanniomyces endolithicus]|uniref:Uncharacterized protein n=1 Tax=Friedmanniomyces endolithicus TaxID=329885 RepID=A0AAN6GZQ0_9PEZI|nr:hypothetical protein LTR91_024957 [Friedmanniomyces endolithicus]KAK0954474.1 hypothetical protein LTS01_023892 [Friedmanniomyces endolithicus]